MSFQFLLSLFFYLVILINQNIRLIDILFSIFKNWLRLRIFIDFCIILINITFRYNILSWVKCLFMIALIWMLIQTVRWDISLKQSILFNLQCIVWPYLILVDCMIYRCTICLRIIIHKIVLHCYIVWVFFKLLWFCVLYNFCAAWSCYQFVIWNELFLGFLRVHLIYWSNKLYYYRIWNLL